MQRGRAWLLLVTALAVIAYLAWALLIRTSAHGPPRPSEAPPAAPLGDSRPETRAIAPAPSDDAPAGTTTSVEDRIEGTVTDESGRPIPDADVQIIWFEFMTASTRPPDRRFEERRVASTVTDALGRYRFEKLVPGEVKNLRASKAGFVSVFTDTVPVPGTRDFRLVTGAPVSGRVIDATTQRPIEGAEILGWFESLAAPAPFRWKEEVVTNRAGVFSFEAVPPGTVGFYLAQPEYLDHSEKHAILSGSKNELVFNMRLGLVIEGVVLHARKGTPVPDLLVTAKAENPLIPRWSARTNKDGVFRMQGVRPGALPFEISGRSISPAFEIKELTEAENFALAKRGKRLEFRVQPTGRAAGRVVTRSGDPVQGARVFVAPVKGVFVLARDPAEHGGSVQDGETRTDASGKFLVDDLTTSPHRVVIEKPGYAIATSDPITVGPDEIRDDVTVTLYQAPAIRGTVTDEVGAPVANAAVTAEVPQLADVVFAPGFGIGQKSRITMTTDEAGRYRTEVPHGGSYTIGVDHPDYVLIDGATVTVKGFEPEVTQDFALKRALSISGHVAGPNRNIEQGAIVRAWPSDGGAPRQAKTGPTGQYKLTRLEAGLFRMNARQPGANLASEFKDAVPAGSDGIDFTLVRAGELVGVVTDSAGIPVPDFGVMMRPVARRSGSAKEKDKHSTAGLAEREQRVQDPEGIFRIVDVDPGTWSIQVFARDLAPTVPVEVKVPGGAPVSLGTIVLKAGGVVFGKVTDPSGAPAEGIIVQFARVRNLPEQDAAAVPPVPVRPWSSKTGPSGEYAVKGLVPGEYYVKAEAKGFLDPPPEILAVTEGSSTEYSFKIKQAASLTLIVKDEVGEPVASALVQVLDQQQRKLPVLADGMGVGHTDNSGQLVLARIPADEKVTIKVVRVGFLVTESVQKLPAGPNGTLALKLQRNH